MALTTEQKASFLFKQSQGVAETSILKDFFEESLKGRILVLNNQLWSQSDQIPATAPVLADGAASGVVRYYQARTMNAVAGVSNSFYLEDLKDSIPFNFGDGSYNYVITSSTGTAIPFGQGDWLVNNTTGTLTFYGSVPANMPPKISFYKYIGAKGAGGSANLPAIYVVATVAERDALSAKQGDLCVVTGVNESYAWSGTSWVLIQSAGAVSSVNGQTGIVNLTASSVNAIDMTQKGIANGVATLDATGLVPVSQLPSIISPVTSVNGQTGDVNLTASSVNAIDMTEKGVANGVATLDTAGFVPLAQIPSIPFPVTSVNGQTGDVNLTASSVNAIDMTEKGIANGVATLDAAGLVPVSQLPSTVAGVSSVNGATGVVILDSNDVGALSLTGGTLNGPLILGPTGTAAGSGGIIQLKELAANGTNYVAFRAADSIASNVTWTLPSADGTSGQVLQTNGSGTLSWGSASATTGTIVHPTGGSTFEYGKANVSLIGDGNTVIGENSGTLITTGGYNTLFGYLTGQQLNDGISNNAFGYNALNKVTSGSSNNAFGNSSLFSLTTGSYNLAIGDSSGFYLSTTSSKNTILNTQATTTTATLNGIVAIGRDSGTGYATATADNQFVLGTANHKYRFPGVAETSLVLGPTGTVTSQTGTIQLRELAANGSNFVGFRAPDSIAADVTWTLPSADGTSGQALTTNGSRILSWTSFFASTGGTLTGALTLGPIGTSTGQGGVIKFTELAANGTSFVALRAPDSIFSDVTWTLPSADGSSGQFLSTNGTGTLSWASAGSGSVVSIADSYVLSSSDNNATIRINNPYRISITVPRSLPANFKCKLIKNGIGSVGIYQVTGTTSATSSVVNSANGYLMGSRYGSADITGYDTETYNLTGDLVNNPSYFQGFYTNGEIYSSAILNDNLYIGGNFTQVGDYSDMVTRSGCFLSSSTGEYYGAIGKTIFSDDLDINGTVNCAIVSGNYIFIGGNFTRFNGQAAKYLVKVSLTDGRIDSSFNQSTGFNGAVLSIAIDSSNNLYCGGSFTSYQGTSRNYIVKMNSTGLLDTSFDPLGGFNSSVNSIVLSNDQTSIYCGGAFTTYRGVGRERIIKLSTSNAAPDATFTIAPSTAFNGIVESIALTSDGTGLYCGGNFTSYGVTSLGYIVKLNASTAAIDTTFNTGTGFNSRVRSVILDGFGNVFCGGDFTVFQTTARQSVAKLNGTTGALDATFDAATGFNSSVRSLSFDSNSGDLICGGIFSTYKGTIRQSIAKINSTNASLITSFVSGNATGNGFSSFVAETTNIAVVRYINTTITFCGGLYRNFRNVNNAVSRNYLASISLSNQMVNNLFDTSSGFDAAVQCMVIDSSGNLTCGGDFTTYKGVARQKIAKINGITAALDATFDAATGFNNTVRSIAFDGTKANIYCGGSFTNYKGTSRQYIAKINASSGALDTTFDSASGFGNAVRAVLVDSAGNVYCGGDFGSYKASTRQGVAKLNGSTAAVDATFDSTSGFNALVRSLLIDGLGNIYCGGDFTTYKLVARQRIAKINGSTAALDTTFDTSSGFSGSVYSMALNSSGSIYCSGSFGTYKGNLRDYIAKINSINGNLDPVFAASVTYSFNGSPTIYTVSIDQNTDSNCIWVAGNFNSYAYEPRRNLAKISATYGTVVY